jgi:hypothetical protein
MPFTVELLAREIEQLQLHIDGLLKVLGHG